MGAGGSQHRGTGRALVEERMRAEISVKLHLATGGKVGHRQCLEDAFRASDHDGDGSIDFSEFCATAAAIGLGVSESELKSAFSRFDVNGDSTIEFAEVVDFMCPRVKTARDAQREVHVQHLERMVGERAPLELNDATEEAVHQGVRRIAQTVHGKEINLRNAFRQWDKDGSGALDVNEFVAALNSLGFSLDLADAQLLFERFDVDRNGKLACWEFVRTLGAFEAELNGEGDVVVGHNTGRGGGGDARVLKPPTPAKRMAEKSRQQQEREKAQREAAQREKDAAIAEAEYAKQREAEALAALAAQKQALGAQQANLDAAARAMQAEELARRQAAMQQQRAMAEAAAAEQAARLKADRDAAMRAGRQAQAQAAQLATLAEAERAEKEALAAELEALRRAQENAQKAQSGADGVDYSSTGLAAFLKPTSDTAVFEKGVYAWTAAEMDESLSDAQLLETLNKRLKYVHTSPAEALAQVVCVPQLAKSPMSFESYGVDPHCLVAFAAQVLYNLSEGRAAKLLAAVSGSLPIVAVPRFLALFGGGTDENAPRLVRLDPKGRKVDALSLREKGLLVALRDFLFEQKSRMKAMFLKCDRDGDGFVSIEEFLVAMEKAGVPCRGLDRKAHDKGSITEDEAMNIVAFFDRDGDGLLSYSEFMSCLQTTKNSVMANKILNTEA